jgi:hypothetical protein
MTPSSGSPCAAATTRAVRRTTCASDEGYVYLPVTGVDNIDDLGATVYAIDDDSFTLTSSTGHTSIGKLQSYDGTSGYGTVFFEAAAVRSI